MSVKFYNTCNGDSGSKYNIWLEVTENSHSISTNMSNLTVALKLKRNDGYNNSAYNLNESENFSEITINNERKVGRNLKIDTRNCATVTLVSWTGNLEHNSDGTLSVIVGGTFTMNGTALSGGDVKGNFNCITIPKISDFTFDKTSVNPEESVTVELLNAVSDFNHILIYEIGVYKQNLSISKGVRSTTFSIPSEWSNAIPDSKQGKVKITLKTYNGSALVGTSIKYLKLVIPETESFLPEFTVSCIYNNHDLVPESWKAIIQNISTATISIENIALKYGAKIADSYITLKQIKKSGLTNEFSLTDSGVLTFTACVTDSRGFSSVRNYSVYVDEYKKPTITCSNIFRCDSSGAPSLTGDCVAVEFRKTQSSVRGLNISYARAKYKKSTESEYSDSVLLTSSPFIISGPFQENSSYDFIIFITDSITQVAYEIKRTISSCNLPFNIKKGGNGAAFGCYAEKDNELTVGYDLNVKGLFKYDSLNNSITLAQNMEIVYLDIRNYASLRLISINAKIKIIENASPNIACNLFTINGFSFKHTYALPVHQDFSSPSAGVISAYMNTAGIVKVYNQVGFTAGATVNVNSVIDY